MEETEEGIGVRQSERSQALAAEPLNGEETHKFLSAHKTASS